MAAAAPRGSRRARRRYLLTAALLGLAIFVSGWLLNRQLNSPAALPQATQFPPQAGDGELDAVFAAAVEQMQRRRYRRALELWHRALLINPELPEIKVNMGFTLFELGRYPAARDFFVAAMAQNEYQANAYYGLALVHEQMGDLEAALGAMRSFIHLSGEQDRPFLRRARAALWEWEAQLRAQRDAAGQPSPDQ